MQIILPSPTAVSAISLHFPRQNSEAIVAVVDSSLDPKGALAMFQVGTWRLIRLGRWRLIRLLDSVDAARRLDPNHMNSHLETHNVHATAWR